jgi:hypothetical protein
VPHMNVPAEEKSREPSESTVNVTVIAGTVKDDMRLYVRYKTRDQNDYEDCSPACSSRPTRRDGPASGGG